MEGYSLNKRLKKKKEKHRVNLVMDELSYMMLDASSKKKALRDYKKQLKEANLPRNAKKWSHCYGKVIFYYPTGKLDATKWSGLGTGVRRRKNNKKPMFTS